MDGAALRADLLVYKRTGLLKSPKEFSDKQRVSTYCTHIMNFLDDLQLLTAKVDSRGSWLVSGLYEFKPFTCLRTDPRSKVRFSQQRKYNMRGKYQIYTSFYVT